MTVIGITTVMPSCDKTTNAIVCSSRNRGRAGMKRREVPPILRKGDRTGRRTPAEAILSPIQGMLKVAPDGALGRGREC
jgi:hypothetical protein